MLGLIYFSSLRKTDYEGLLLVQISVVTVHQEDALNVCNSAIGFNLLSRPIDLFYDTRHLCTRFRVDGIKATSRAFSGDKQKFAGTSNGGRVCLFFQNETTILVMQNVQIRFIKFYVIIARCVWSLLHRKTH